MSSQSKFSALYAVSRFCGVAEEVGFTPEVFGLLADDRELLRDILGSVRIRLIQSGMSISDVKEGQVITIPRALLDTELVKIDYNLLSIRISNALLNHNVKTVRDLVSMSEANLRVVRHVGKKGLVQIAAFLAIHKLNLSMIFEPTGPQEYAVISSGAPFEVTGEV